MVYRVEAEPGPADQGHQDRLVPHLPRRAVARAGRPLSAHPGPGARAGGRAAVRRPARVAGRVLGTRPTSSCTVSRRCSRPSAGICSRSPRPPPGPSSPACRRRGSPAPATAVTTSGTPRSTCLPFLTYTSPQMARSALRFRYNMLDAARRRAEDLAQSGALFPWRTINGEEASAYYAAGTAQYHIDADIAYALCKYVAATGDQDFMNREGVDILVETARMWADLGFWRENGDGEHVRSTSTASPGRTSTPRSSTTTCSPT